jgi:hypothetical protein
MRKIDLKREKKRLYNLPSSEFQMITVPRINFLMIDGAGDPSHTAPEKMLTVLRQPAFESQ